MQYLFEYCDTMESPYEAFLYDTSYMAFPIRPHWHYFMEIIYMLEGTGLVETGFPVSIKGEPRPLRGTARLGVTEKAVEGFLPLAPDDIIRAGQALQQSLAVIAHLRPAQYHRAARQYLFNLRQQQADQADIPDITGEPQNLRGTAEDLRQDQIRMIVDRELQNADVEAAPGLCISFQIPDRGAAVDELGVKSDEQCFHALTSFFIKTGFGREG